VQVLAYWDGLTAHQSQTDPQKGVAQAHKNRHLPPIWAVICPVHPKAYLTLWLLSKTDPWFWQMHVRRTLRVIAIRPRPDYLEREFSDQRASR
jgi:hypothetical protein